MGHQLIWDGSEMDHHFHIRVNTNNLSDLHNLGKVYNVYIGLYYQIDELLSKNLASSWYYIFKILSNDFAWSASILEKWALIVMKRTLISTF